jgi:hypothetical protein
VWSAREAGRMGSIDDIRATLAEQAEALADAALDLLSRAVHADEPEQVPLKNLERRVTRARRSVEKAVELLDGNSPD